MFFLLILCGVFDCDHVACLSCCVCDERTCCHDTVSMEVFDFLLLSFEIVRPLLKPALFLTTVIVSTCTLSLATGIDFITSLVIMVIVMLVLLWCFAPHLLERIRDTTSSSISLFFKGSDSSSYAVGSFPAVPSAVSSAVPSVGPSTVPSVIPSSQAPSSQTIIFSQPRRQPLEMSLTDRLNCSAMLMRNRYDPPSHGSSFDQQQRQQQFGQSFISKDEGVMFSEPRSMSARYASATSSRLDADTARDWPLFEYLPSTSLSTDIKSNSSFSISNVSADQFLGELKLSKNSLPVLRDRFFYWMHDEIILPLAKAIEQPDSSNYQLHSRLFQAITNIPYQVVAERVIQWKGERKLQSYDWNGELTGSNNSDALILSPFLRAYVNNTVPGTVLSWSCDGNRIYLLERERTTPPHFEIQINGTDKRVRPGPYNFADAVVLFMRAAQLHNDMFTLGVPELDSLLKKLDFDGKRPY